MYDNMKAMIFAAGLGTRLKPFTTEHPKALVPVGGVPMLQRVILKLRDEGFESIIINVHHFAEQIKAFLKQNNNFGVDIEISDETDLLLDTGGGILKARPFLDCGEPVLLCNADILTDVSFSEIYDAHVHSGADATLLASERQTSRYLCFDRQNYRLEGWVNISTGETRPDSFMLNEESIKLAFGGVHVISSAVFPLLAAYSDNPKFSITSFYVDNCSELVIKPYTPANKFHWFDVGKPETLDLADNYLRSL